MFDKILLAVDGSQPSDAAVEAAIALAGKTGAAVEAVHVRVHDRIISKAGSGPDLETTEDATVLLASTVDKLKSAGLTAHGTMRHAATTAIARDIIVVADEVGADVIVVGSRGLSNLSGMLLGSVSSKVIHLAGRPVLVTHPSSQHDRSEFGVTERAGASRPA
jgi:nucleotide-binding universal stress UspA family protein